MASGLEKTYYPTKMGGQVSAPVKININANPTNKNFKVGSMEISLASTNRNALIWDTSTGIIKDTATNEIVPYSGTGYGKLAPGTELTVEGDASIDLNSLYFLYY